MKKGIPQSPVVSFVSQVYAQAWGANGKSWRRLNGSLWQTLKIAIEVGFKFQPDDFKQIYELCRGGLWLHGESAYRVAVRANNTSACLSYEQWKDRPPFIFNNTRRLYVGASIPVAFQVGIVTSFTADGSTVIVCRYKKYQSGHDGEWHGSGKPIGIHRFTPKQVRDLCKVQADSLIEQMQEYIEQLAQDQAVAEQTAALQHAYKFLQGFTDAKTDKRLQKAALAVGEAIAHVNNRQKYQELTNGK